MSQVHASLVSKQEAEALKEMIFRRARERAQAFENNLKESYTTSIQNDVMDIARESFVSSRNPFSQIVENESLHKELESDGDIVNPSEHRKEIETRIINKSQEVEDNIATVQVQTAMIDARAELNKKTSFMGALNFLNAQASIALVSKKANSFEAFA